MHISTGIVAIVSGLLCLPGIYIKFKNDTKAFHRFFTYIHGSFGFFICLWGIFLTIHSFINSISWLQTGWIFYWLTYNLTGVAVAGVGFLLGFRLIQYFVISKVPEDMETKAHIDIFILINAQIISGFISIAFGIWVIIFNSLPYRF